MKNELSPPDGFPDGLWDACLNVTAAAVSDVLHKRGMSQRAMRPDIQSAREAVPVVGIARTMASKPCEQLPEPGHEYTLLFSAIDGLGRGEVLVTDAMGCCVWGELCTERAMMRNANGAVIDGYYRDSARVKRPAFLSRSRPAPERHALPPRDYRNQRAGHLQQRLRHARRPDCRK